MDSSIWWLLAAALLGGAAGEVLYRSLRRRSGPVGRLLVIGLLLACGTGLLIVLAGVVPLDADRVTQAAALAATALAWASGAVLWGARRVRTQRRPALRRRRH